MSVDINAVNLEVMIRSDENFSYEGHLIDTHSGDQGLTLRCRTCGEAACVDEVPTGLHKWETICYLLGKFDECSGEGEDMEQRVRAVLNRYLGEPTDDQTVRALEEDIQNALGGHVPVNVRVP